MSQMALTDRFFAMLTELENAGYKKNDIEQLDALFTAMIEEKEDVTAWGGLKEKPYEKGIKMLFEGLAVLGPYIGVDTETERQFWIVTKKVNQFQAAFEGKELTDSEGEDEEADFTVSYQGVDIPVKELIGKEEAFKMLEPLKDTLKEQGREIHRLKKQLEVYKPSSPYPP